MVDAKTDRLIIGAGAIGLAIARQFSMAGDQVVLIECNAGFGMETSSRNSEVIHAGIYYPASSHKARLCVKGAHKMYAYCAARGVKTSQHGKLIVATDQEQEEKLDALMAAGNANHVPDLALLGKNRLAIIIWLHWKQMPKIMVPLLRIKAVLSVLKNRPVAIML